MDVERPPSAPATAPSSMDVEHPIPATSPGGRGLVPPSGPASTTGGFRPVSAPVQAAHAPAGPSAAAPAAAPATAAPVGPAARAGRFGAVYSRRPTNGPLPIQRHGVTAAELQPPVPSPQPMRGPSPPPTLWRLTRLQSGTIQPVNYRNLSADHVVASPVPSNYRSALADPNWRATMADELQALIDNGTWRLVPRPPGANVVTGKWIFKHKYHSDGSLARHKARWVVRGFSQQHGIDYDETFSPVVKPGTIRTVLSIAASHHWPIHQLDVKNAFLHGHLDESLLPAASRFC